MSNKSTISDATRVKIVRLYLEEIERVCKEYYEGDYDKMPGDLAELPIDWKSLAKKLGMHTTTVAQTVRHAIRRDEIMNQV